MGKEEKSRGRKVFEEELALNSVGRWRKGCAFIYSDEKWTVLELKANHHELLLELGNGTFHLTVTDVCWGSL
jgi:hypothetical protein